MPTGAQVRSGVRGAGANPSNVQRVEGRHRAADRVGRHAADPNSGGYPGSPTGAEVRDRVRNAGPEVGGRGSRSGRRGRAGGSRSRPGSSTFGAAIPSGPRTGALIAEFLLAMLIITIGVFTSAQPYQARMTKFLWQTTSLFLIFFVLALLDKGGRMSKAAVMFGALIDIGILFAASVKSLPGQAGSSQGGGAATTTPIAAFTSAIGGGGAQVGEAVLNIDAAAEPAPAHQIPNELGVAGSSGGAAVKQA